MPLQLRNELRHRPAKPAAPTSRLQISQTPDHLVNEMTGRLASLVITPNILRMPNEILDHIASHVFPRHEVEVMEGVPRAVIRKPFVSTRRYGIGESHPAKLWRTGLHDARNMALVCRRLTRVVELLMYQHISMLEDYYCNCCNQYPRTALPYLVRTLIERPDLATQCKKLVTWIRDRRLIKSTAEPGLCPLNPYSETFTRAIAHLANVRNASFAGVADWSAQLFQHQEAALHAILITLLPNLRDLKLYAPMSYRSMFSYENEMGRERSPTEIVDYSYFDVALRNSSIDSLYAGIAWPIKHFPASTLTKMEIDMFFFTNRTDLLDSTMVLPKVRSVSVIINFAILDGRHLPQFITTLDAHIGLMIFLRDMIPNIEAFSIDMPRGTFAYKQTDETHDRWGEALPTAIDMANDMKDIEYHPMDDPSDPTAWNWLMQALHPVKKKLKHFSLPRNWFSSTGRTVKPLPSLKDFTRLETLSLPRVAIVGNPYSDTYVEEEDEYPAVDFLPKSLKTLVIYQVDVDSCAWVQEAFAQKASLFPNWYRLGLAFRNDYVATLSPDFPDLAREAGVEVTAFWQGQYKMVVER